MICVRKNPAFLILLGAGLLSCVASNAPTPWIRFQHPYIPVSFEAPATMNLRPELHYWGNGSLAQKNGIGERFVEYGMRTVYRNPNVPAIEVKFAWLDGRHAITPPMTLENLYLDIYDANRVVDFYLLTFFPDDIREKVRSDYSDAGSLTIGGRIGRHLQDVPPGDPYRAPTEIYIVPLDPQNALVIKVEFCEPTDEERNIITPQIINSIKIDFPRAN